MIENFTISALIDDEVDALQHLMDNFVTSHPSFQYRDDYWPPTRDWLLRLNNNKQSAVLVAKADRGAIGFVAGQILDNAPWLYPEKIGYGALIVVGKEYRKRGAGDMLWGAIKDWFLEKGIMQVDTFTECGNAVAESFWEKRGFARSVDRRKCYIGGLSAEPEF